MPYPRAHLFVLGVMLVIVLGFWPSYFGALGGAAWQFHAHGIAASLWVATVALQSWSARSPGRLVLHRQVGRASLLRFPFLIAGFCAIIDRSAKGYLAHDDPVRVMFAGAFLSGMAVAIAAYATVFYRALKFRRKVWIHSGYLLATPLILFESPFSRVLNSFAPPFMINGPADFGHVLTAILWSMALELVFVAALWLRYREKAAPFLVAGGFIGLQMLMMGWLNDLPIYLPVLNLIGHAPGLAVWGTGFVIGALTSWAGWQAGKGSAL
jgi:hypothetical protein